MARRMVIDPPSGWMYGFPKIYDPSPEVSCEEWLIANGYPMEEASWAANHSHSWFVEEDAES